MKEIFGVNYHVHFHFGSYGRRDDIVFRHVVSEAARPDVFSLNLQILRVIVTLKVYTVCVGA